MTVDKNENNRRRSAVALTGACAALALGTAHAATYFEPRIGFNVTYTDNVELAPKGSERDELIGQLRPGITFSHESRSLAAFLDYSAQAIYFQDAADSQVFHQGELGVQYEAVPEWLYFDLGASRTQTVIDPRQPINAGNMFQSGNLADSTSGQISPILQHKFRFVELEASYTRGFLNYSRADTVDDQTPITDLSFDDSENTSAYFALRSADREARVTWETSYHHDRVDYDIALPFEYDEAYGELGYLIGRGFRLIGRYGLETDPLQHRTDGGLDETSYAGGFEYHGGLHNVLRILVGHRFFGRTYEGAWRYTGRVLESQVNYTEGPTTQTQDRVVRPVTAPGEFPPGLDNAFSRTTSDVYLSKLLDGRIGLRGRVTDIFLGANWERREYLFLGGIEDKYAGVSLLVSRRLGPRVTLEASVAYTDSELREGGAYTDRTYAVSLLRQIGNKTHLTLTGNRIDRTGISSAYTANWVLLGIEVNFAGADHAGGDRGFAGGRPATRANTLPTIRQR